MIKLTGPALGKRAAGTLAGQLTFSFAQGQAYVKKHRKPKQPRTGPQVGMRAMLKFLAKEWHALSSADKDSWNDLAGVRAITPFNAYQAENLRNWRNDLYPSKTFPAARNQLDGVITSFFIGGISRAIWIYLRTIPPADCWGWSVHIGPSPSPGNHWNNLIVARVRTDDQPDFWYHSPYAVGTYYATAFVFSPDGVAPRGFHRGPFTVTA